MFRLLYAARLQGSGGLCATGHIFEISMLYVWPCHGIIQLIHSVSLIVFLKSWTDVRTSTHSRITCIILVFMIKQHATKPANITEFTLLNNERRQD